MLAYDFKWSIIWEAPYGGWMLEGIWTTIQLGLLSCLSALVIGTVIGTLRVTPFRPLRLAAAELGWDWAGAGLQLAFELPAGAYATALLRELLRSPT